MRVHKLFFKKCYFLSRRVCRVCHVPCSVLCLLTVPSPSVWAVRSFSSSLEEVLSSLILPAPPLKQTLCLLSVSSTIGLWHSHVPYDVREASDSFVGVILLPAVGCALLVSFHVLIPAVGYAPLPAVGLPFSTRCGSALFYPLWSGSFLCCVDHPSRRSGPQASLPLRQQSSLPQPKSSGFLSLGSSVTVMFTLFVVFVQVLVGAAALRRCVFDTSCLSFLWRTVRPRTC